MLFLYFSLLLLTTFSCSGQSEQTTVESPGEDSIIMADSTINPSVERAALIPSLQDFSKVDASVSYSSTKKSLEEERLRLQSADITLDSLQQLFKKALLHKIIPYWEGIAWSLERHSSQPRTGRIACGYFVSTTLQDVGLNINRYQLAQQSHVGYILKEKGELYLIHSNYINAGGIQIEAIENSEVFRSYHLFHLVQLSTNEQLLNAWVNGSRIQVVIK